MIRNTKNLVFYTDQGRKYQMKQHESLLKKIGIVQSILRKGNCWNNAVIEYFFAILKSELLYLKKFRLIEELKNKIIQYMYYYNKNK